LGAAFFLLLMSGGGPGAGSRAFYAVVLVALAAFGLYAMKVHRDFAREDAERAARRRRAK